MLNNMKLIIENASNTKNTIIGFNIFGFEDAQAVIKAGEELNTPILLMLNKLAVEYMPLKCWAGLLRPLAQQAKVPVSIHLDHCKCFKTVVTAIHEGFTSVMYDGSQLSVEENIKRTKEIVKIARCFDVAVEGEVGSVPYADIPGAAFDMLTTPEDARKFEKESGVDWMAIAVGQVHRLVDTKSIIDFDSLQKIEDCTSIPLVIHGGSGITDADLQRLLFHKIGKMNFGTGLRVAFGETLKKSIENNPNEFDRLNLFRDSVASVTEEAKRIITKVSNKEDNNGNNQIDNSTSTIKILK